MPASGDAGAGAVIEACGDQAFMVRFGMRIDRGLNARALALAARVREAAPGWLLDCVPSYAAVLVTFDALAVEPDAVEEFIRAKMTPTDAAPNAGSPAARLVEVPVCYAPEMAPDLGDVATACGLSADDVVRRHAAAVYRVYTLGFRPGFPFLGTVDQAIAVPRLGTPRARVPAGAVGIAGHQTGIYPSAGPGGWRLIGRTPWRLFDPTAAAAHRFRLAAGDEVRFVPIAASDFRLLIEEPDVD